MTKIIIKQTISFKNAKKQNFKNVPKYPVLENPRKIVFSIIAPYNDVECTSFKSNYMLHADFSQKLILEWPRTKKIALNAKKKNRYQKN